LQIPVVISALHASWDYMINRIAVTTTGLASVTVTLKDTLTNLAPLAG
jgi:hypothetical protein